MADLINVNYPLERKKLEHQIAQQKTNILAAEMREMQLQQELEQIAVNKEACQKYISQYQNDITELNHQEQQMKESNGG